MLSITPSNMQTKRKNPFCGTSSTGTSRKEARLSIDIKGIIFNNKKCYLSELSKYHFLLIFSWKTNLKFSAKDLCIFFFILKISNGKAWCLLLLPNFSTLAKHSISKQNTMSLILMHPILQHNAICVQSIMMLFLVLFVFEMHVTFVLDNAIAVLIHFAYFVALSSKIELLVYFSTLHAKT